jgi:hypothetical protein
MKRSVFYDGVEIYSEHLNYIEESKAEAIKNIVLTFGICGPVRGLVVAPDPNDAYKVMITAGVGYTYGGEYYELTSNVTGVAISNAIGAKNYVCVKVTEVDEYPLPNVITGEVKYTRRNQRYDVVVLGETEWLNLADKSMYGLLAIVYGSGGFVRGSDIRRAVVIPASLLFVEQQPVVVRGVKVVTVSNNTPLGKGTLGYRYDNVEQKSYLKWKAPGGAGFGAEVAIGGDGVYKLWDQLGVSYLQVEVSVADLLAESVNEELQIIDMLEQRELNTGTMIDVLHRSMMGGGMPSIRNPHGQTLDDLEPGEIQDMIKHQSRFHKPVILGQYGSLTAKPSVSGTELILNQIITGEYIVSGGKAFNGIGPLWFDFTGKNAGDYTIYVDGTGVVSLTTGRVDSKNYFVIGVVNWNGSVLELKSDLRKWNELTPDDILADLTPDREKNPNEVATKLSDNLAMFRWVLKNILGGNWKSVPPHDLIQLSEHMDKNYAGGDIAHGVKAGHNGGFDADMLDGKHLDEILNILIANADNSDKLDGFHASKTPGADIIVPLNSAGILDLSLTSAKINVYTVRRIDGNSLDTYYPLAIGEEVVYSWNTVAFYPNFPLKIATAEGLYQMIIVAPHQTSHSISSYLYPNDSVYASAFRHSYVGMSENSGSVVSGDTVTYSSISLHRATSGGITVCFISTYTVAKFVVFIQRGSKSTTDGSGLLRLGGSRWIDFVTSWTSLGTLNTSAVNGTIKILVRRLA